MIDLHTHTNESDGTYSPAELVSAAVRSGVTTLAITDHDTFAGYELAAPHARAAGLRLHCGIEISTALGNPKERTVHLLGYFFKQAPALEFRQWLEHMQACRRDRNVRLAARLQDLGLDVQIGEVNAIGRSLTGRPHFARVLVNKGYVSTLQEAFEKYLDESAPGYVDREEPLIEDGIRRVNEAGGISSLAHPVRLGRPKREEEEALIARLAHAGMRAIEAYHSDHTARDTARYLGYAAKYGLLVTGGSDFHGANKPQIQLGSGHNNNLSIPPDLMDALLQ